MPRPYKERTHESSPRTFGTDRGRRAARADGSHRTDRGSRRHAGGLTRGRCDGRSDRRHYTWQPDQPGWDQQAADAVDAVAEEAGIQGVVAENGGYEDITPILRDLAAGGAGLIICHARGYQTVCPEV